MNDELREMIETACPVGKLMLSPMLEMMKEGRHELVMLYSAVRFLTCWVLSNPLIFTQLLLEAGENDTAAEGLMKLAGYSGHISVEEIERALDVLEQANEAVAKHKAKALALGEAFSSRD